MLAFVTLGSVYVLTSVGVAIARRRSPPPPGDPVSEAMTVSELRTCFDELDAIADDLARHLENFHTLLGGYDPAEAQRWADEGSRWRKAWTTLGRRCRFPELRTRNLRKELEEMIAAHEELGQTEARYTQALVRFGKDEVPRLDRIRARLDDVRPRIERAH